MVVFHSEVKCTCLTSEQSCYVVLNAESYVEQWTLDLLHINSRCKKRSWNQEQDWCCISKPSPGRLPS